ncbi:MAG: RNA polymerase sigma factor [Rhizobiaceae bacterium]|nr:RNA polymerase sigma factor [Rhizobiaceae bacterium]
MTSNADAGLCLCLAKRPALVAYATPLLGSREAAEDIVQDAFLKFIPAMARPGAAQQPLAYLYRIVRNLAFDTLKRRRIEAREAAAEPPHWAFPQDMPTPEQGLLFCDEIRRVREVLDGLPPDVRTAVEMHRFGGHTLEEIAERLGISVATAHRHVRSALVKIAERLDGDD